MKKNIIITGVAGFIGSNIVKKMKNTKIKVISGTKGDQSKIFADISMLKRKIIKKRFVSLNEGISRSINSIIK